MKGTFRSEHELSLLSRFVLFFVSYLFLSNSPLRQLRLDTPINASPVTHADISIFSAQRDLNYYASCSEASRGIQARLRVFPFFLKTHPKLSPLHADNIQAGVPRVHVRRDPATNRRRPPRSFHVVSPSTSQDRIQVSCPNALPLQKTGSETPPDSPSSRPSHTPSFATRETTRSSPQQVLT